MEILLLFKVQVVAAIIIKGLDQMAKQLQARHWGLQEAFIDQHLLEHDEVIKAVFNLMDWIAIKVVLNEVQQVMQANEVDDQLFQEEFYQFLNENSLLIYLDIFVYLVPTQHIWGL